MQEQSAKMVMISITDHLFNNALRKSKNIQVHNGDYRYRALLSGFFQYSGRTALLLFIQFIMITISIDTLSTSTLTSRDVIQNDIIGLINCIK
jgi:hypothetical protein